MGRWKSRAILQKAARARNGTLVLACPSFNLQTGKAIWESERIKGSVAAVVTIYEKNLVLLVTSKDARAAKDKPDMNAFNMATGGVLWASEFPDNVDLHAIEGAGRFIVTYDLSGHQPPVYDNDSLYFTYGGLHRFHVNTGTGRVFQVKDKKEIVVLSIN